MRGGHRAVVTKYEKEVNGIIRSHGNDLSSDMFAKLESIMATLKLKQKQLSKLDVEIVAKCDMEDIEKEMVESSDIATRIEEIIAKINVCQKGGYGESEAVSQFRCGLSPGATPFIPATDMLNRSGASLHSSGTGVKLPKIMLPSFNGDITKFQSFWQSFWCAVHENESLSDVHKLNNLMRLLEGHAYKALEDLEITEENYGHGIEILKRRFGISQQIISSHASLAEFAES